MGRPKKESDFLSIRIDKQSSEKLKELCDEIGLTKTKLVEKSIDKFYDEYKKTGKL